MYLRIPPKHIILTVSNLSLKKCVRSQVKQFVGCRHSSSEYILKSPFSDVNLPNVPLHQYIWKDIHKWSNHTAIECGVTGRKYSYNELLLNCKRFGSSLRKLGLKKGDTIGIILPNSPEFPIAYLGALESDLIATTINPSYTKDEVIYQLEDCNTKWIICHPTNLNVVQEAKRQLKGNLNIICTHNLDGSSPGSNNNVILFEETINDSVQVTESSTEDLDLSSTALIPYSSGTTGLPKGTCLSHSSIAANMEQISHSDIEKYFETTRDHQDVIPAVLPFFHLYGNAIILLNALRKGAKIITLPRFDPKIFLNILENNSNILLYVVPPMVFFLGNHEVVKAKHLRGIRELMNGAAPCSSHDIAKVKEKADTKILFSQGYGMTESSPVLTIYKPDGLDTDNTATVGKMVSNTWGKVVDTETGETLPTNISGELCFKGPQLMKYYLNKPKATAETIDANGWLHTGDVGYCDQDGYFYITDRLKDLIKVKGFQVAPAELEEVLRKHPGVLEAGVVGVPSERTGETPVAFVQTITGTKVSEEDIKTFVASQLSKHKHLSSVRFVQTIPKTSSGKILRKELKKEALVGI